MSPVTVPSSTLVKRSRWYQVNSASEHSPKKCRYVTQSNPNPCRHSTDTSLSVRMRSPTIRTAGLCRQSGGPNWYLGALAQRCEGDMRQLHETELVLSKKQDIVSVCSTPCSIQNTLFACQCGFVLQTTSKLDLARYFEVKDSNTPKNLESYSLKLRQRDKRVLLGNERAKKDPFSFSFAKANARCYRFSKKNA